MIRFLSAIGMSQYTQPQKLDRFIRSWTKEGDSCLRTYVRRDAGRMQFELTKKMGPFFLTVTGQKGEQDLVGGFFPGVRERRVLPYLDCEVIEERPGVFFLSAVEGETGEQIKFMMTTAKPFFSKGVLEAEERGNYSCYGLSVEGKVLLGVKRSEEEEKAIREEEQWRREILNKVQQGDENALREVETYAAETAEEIQERLRQEDVYTILDGFFVPRGNSNFFVVLGDILYVDKLLNPLTEEWSYRLEVKTMGTRIGIYINPKDLVGVPCKGRRFLGEVFLQGAPERGGDITGGEGFFD